MEHCYAMEKQKPSARKGFALICLCEFTLEFNSCSVEFFSLDSLVNFDIILSVTKKNILTIGELN